MRASFIIYFRQTIKNRRTLLREAEERLKRTRDPTEIVDMLHILEASAMHFFLRAQMGKNAGRKPALPGRVFPCGDLVQRLGVEGAQVVVFHGEADLDWFAADFAVFDVGLGTDG